LSNKKIGLDHRFGWKPSFLRSLGGSLFGSGPNNDQGQKIVVTVRGSPAHKLYDHAKRTFKK